MNDYDIASAFQAIEQELIASMIRNMDRHRAEETKEGIEWSMWQAEQLKSLEKYKTESQRKYKKQFSDINAQIGEIIKTARATGNMEQEISILNAIKNGFKGAKKVSSGAAAEFFRLNDRKLEALIKATTHDMQRAETAVLRMADDQYRKTIFNAQVYANSGAGTYEKAVDMATKDMLSRGLNCVEYKNGARHTLSDYADMAIRTASKRAYLTGEGEKRQEWGISTVIVNKRGNPCPKCLPFCGKVLIDDVWSGGAAYINGKQRNNTPTEGLDQNTGKRYPLMSTAVAAGLYHPRCKDGHTTYFEGISTPPDGTWTKTEISNVEKANVQEAEQQCARRQADKFRRLSEYSLDGENKKKYEREEKSWRHRLGSMRDAWNEHEPITLSQLPKKYSEHLNDVISKAPKNIQWLIKDCSDQIVFANEKFSKGAVTRKTGIFINLKEDAMNKRGEWTGVFHEIGHCIDRKKGLSTKNVEFRRFLEKDFETLENSYKIMYSLSQEDAYEEISKVLRESDRYHSISDLIGGITNNKCAGKQGHFQPGYWEKEGRLEAEAFAHFFEATARNDTEKLKLVQEVFPNAYNEFLRVIEEPK